MKSLLELILPEPPKGSKWENKKHPDGIYVYKGERTRLSGSDILWLVFRYIPSNTPHNAYDVLYKKRF
jgi:hypothetical protein